MSREGCGKSEAEEDVERAFIGAGAGEGGPGLPRSEDGSFISARSELDLHFVRGGDGVVRTYEPL